MKKKTVHTVCQVQDAIDESGHRRSGRILYTQKIEKYKFYGPATADATSDGKLVFIL